MATTVKPVLKIEIQIPGNIVKGLVEDYLEEQLGKSVFLTNLCYQGGSLREPLNYYIAKGETTIGKEDDKTLG